VPHLFAEPPQVPTTNHELVSFPELSSIHGDLSSLVIPLMVFSQPNLTIPEKAKSRNWVKRL